ncbi:lysylphosphatidylglycerol synthase transmembrane domain-containing protein [Ferrimicrobium sp.]|uniref:lysylphosphatidylglycerol synthase transmembrane domain-containing protein n=1 Tax=Ferrimicrobium sp. TaxID=2926050 RepID=UPI00261437AA|nr:lysylphosphatidylglycerol synthase transmembrane domain-containing protein [Ferrimicrobium sp.]
MSTWRSKNGGSRRRTSRHLPTEQSREVITGTRRSLGKLIRHFAIRGIWGFAILLVIEYLVIPQIAGARKTLHLLSHANYWLIPLAILAEGFSLFAYAKLTSVVLPHPQPSLKSLAKVDLSGLAVSHVLPGGTASGAGLTVRLLNGLGVRGTDAGVALATQGIGSAVVLNLMLWLALIVSLPLFGFNVLYLIVAGLGIVLMAAVIALVLTLTRGNDRMVLLVDRLVKKLPFLRRFQAPIHAGIIRAGQRVRALASDPQLLKRAITWAACNWLFDALSLWIMLLAFGSLVNPDALLVSYGIANVAAAIPITPGGLGVVEGIMIPLITGFGTAKGIAILGVLSYRLFNFWIPIPIGVGTYVSLKLSRGEEITMELDRIDPPPDDEDKPKR